ncbi:sulfotransferase family protein [Marivirga sp.]|uniref:sulfotransferase family protein n=1 Tax=Marivirga sp. TaxID=2018662 RepID=UPI003DA79316
MRNEIGQNLPDFLIIGAGKSGTTSLDYYLNQHPEVYMATVKEPNFLAYVEHDFADISDYETIQHYKGSITSYNEYLELFRAAKNNQVIGEISNTTMYMPHAISAIKKYLQEVKLIAILRQPAERLFSRYSHLLRVGKVPTDSFEKEVFNKDSIWWKRADLVQEGFYAKHLLPFYNNFDNSNIKVLLFEDLVKDTNATMKEIVKFLEIKEFNFETDTQFNQSGKIKNESINKLVGHESVIMKFLKRSFPNNYNNIKNNKILKKTVEKLRAKNIDKVKLNNELKNKITSDIYQEDILDLQKLLKKDLSHWLT